MNPFHAFFASAMVVMYSGGVVVMNLFVCMCPSIMVLVFALVWTVIATMALKSFPWSIE